VNKQSRYIDVVATAQTVMKIFIALLAVAAVGVSTAQVITTLAVDDVKYSSAHKGDGYSGNAELLVTLVDGTDAGENTLVLKNVTNTDLHIRRFHPAAVAVNDKTLESAERKEPHAVSLQPGQQMSVILNSNEAIRTREGTRATAMKGRVIGGAVVLYAD